MSYSVKKATIPFKIKIDTGPDLTGKEANFSLTYYKDSDQNTNLASGVTFTESTSIPGLYFSSDIVVATAGEYTFNIQNTVDSLGNVSMPVTITSASIDDIYNAVDTLETNLNAVKTQIDTLDEAELNNIAESVANVQTTINNVKDLIDNKTSTLIFENINNTADFTEGDLITGQTSGSIGRIETITFSTPNTILTVVDVVGTFVVGETVTGTTETIDFIQEQHTAVDSVMEFVKQISEGLEAGGTALVGIETFLADILSGEQYLSDGTTLNPLFDATNPGVATSKELQESLTTLYNDIVTALGSGLADLIGSPTDTSTAETLFGRIKAVQLVIDSNNSLLTNGTYGLQQIKSVVDNLSINLGTVGTNVTSIKNSIDNATYGLSAINDKLDSMDSKLDSILSASTQSALVFA